MVHPDRPPANGFVRRMRKMYNPVGFQRGYNFILWFIFGGAMTGFVLARLMYLNINGIFCPPNTPVTAALPGECYYYKGGHYRVGIILHLGTILPAGLLAVTQFVPAIRHKLLIFHRVNGYLIITLLLCSNAGALMIARRAFGGTLATQSVVGTLVIATTTSVFMAYYNIKRLQIDQHRAWMLRVWFYAGTIITMRIVMIIAVQIISMIGSYYYAVPCDKLAWFFPDPSVLPQVYPSCTPYVQNSNTTSYTVINANFTGNVFEVMASFNMTFGMAAWISFFMHAVGVEIYLKLTPREAERLRNVSYERQMEAGMKNPGNCGTTVQRFGDANPWIPAAKRHISTDTETEIKDQNLSASDREEQEVHLK